MRSANIETMSVLKILGLSLVISGSATAQQAGIEGPLVFEPVTPFIFEGDLGRLPKTTIWQPGDSLQEMGDLRLAAPGRTPSTVGGARATGIGAAPVQQGSTGSAFAAFDGIPATGLAPPDPVGDVGPNHYVQMVNIAFAVYNKSGVLLAGPSPINALWAGFGGPCEALNQGDPIVRYDHLADRWLISQFAIGAGFECIAISRTADPVAGGWFLYAFQTPGAPDYPKIGVWPDGYYMGTQRGFPNSGLDVFAFDRIRMLNGLPAPSVQFNVGAPSLFLLPSDLDGPSPPTGTPNFFVRHVDGDQWGGADRLEMFAFTVNWTNPATSTFTQLPNLAVVPFDAVLCTATLLSVCVPQPGTPRRLEALSAWMMWRLQYRNFGTYETLVTNHTIDADSTDHAGIRWYELRRDPGGAWAVFQQGTFAPDGGAPGLADDVHRWMGSIAMDKDGSVALGFSAGSDSVFPSIRYTGRLVADPAGAMPIGEVTLVAGGGSQTGSSRWGNYSTMDVDPTDDCTFWYTAEYYPITSAAGWRTRIASFQLPSCQIVRPVLGHEVGFAIGGLLTDDSLRLNSGFNTVFRYRRHRFVNNLSWEIESGVAFTEDPAQSGVLASLQLHLVAHLNNVSNRVLPFVLVGVGVSHYNSLGFSDTAPLITLGAGSDFRWSQRVGFRFDARVLWLRDLISPGWTTNGQLLWGPTFAF